MASDQPWLLAKRKKRGAPFRAAPHTRFATKSYFAATGFFQVRFGALVTRPFLMALAVTRT